MNDLPPLDDVSIILISLIVLAIAVMVSGILFATGIITNNRFVSKQKVDKFSPPLPRPDPPTMPPLPRPDPPTMSTYNTGQTTINLNRQCTVVLTSEGVDRLHKMHQQLGVEPSDKYNIGDELSTELWRIMGIFGPAMLHDCDSPIEPDIRLLLHVEVPLSTTLMRRSKHHE